MVEVKKSLRPKPRPKGLGLSSTRPRSRPLSDEEGIAKQEAAAVKQAQSLDQVRKFGNLEFRADMDEQLRWNPLARLGFEPDQSVVGRPAYNSPDLHEGIRYPYNSSQEYIDDTLPEAAFGAEYRDIVGRVKPGSVVVNSNTAKNPVWSHEYTHGGLEKVIEYLNEDKQFFKNKYGEETVKLLEKIELNKVEGGNPLEKGPNEKLTEMLDDVSKDAEVDLEGNLIPAAGTGLGTMENTRTAVSDHEASTDRVQLRRNLEEGRVNDADMSTRLFFEQNLPGYAGIFKAAEDMLEKQGEPLPSEKRGWWEQKANKWLSGKGLFNKGGLAEQTEEALGWTAESKKFAEANPVDIKAPEGLSIKNVPAFKRPMSAGPSDEWTGRQDELGNREYKSKIDGSTYFIKPDADQRTELEKIQQDIIPAVKKYLANPTAPSKEQTIEFLKTAAGDAWETISIPGDLVSGDKTLGDITLGDVFEVAGSAAVASLPMSVPEGSMRTFGGSNPPTYEPRQKSLSSQIDEFFDLAPQEYLDVLNTKLILFREPILEFAETVDIPKKGLLGSEFLNLIKKNDSIPETSLQEGIIEPGKRYTKDELLESLGAGKITSGTFKSVANIASDKPKQFESNQRQGKDAGFEGGRELEYFDIPIDTSIGFPGKKFKANEQHYDSDTLVHVRGSIIDPQDGGFEDTDFLSVIGGEDYLLVEEIQSDLLTKGFVRPKNKFDADFSNATDDFSRFRMVSYGEAFGSVDKEIKSVVKELEIDVGKKTTDLIYSILDRPFSRTHTPKETTALLNYHELIQKKLTDKKIDNEIGTLDLDSIYQAYLTNKKISDTYPNPNDIGLPPIRKNKQAVDEALKILIAKAAQSDVTRIVIPPAERIALARGRKLQEEKGDRFYRTYVTDLEKSLSELQDNYPVKIYNAELPYKRHEDFVGFVPERTVDEDILLAVMDDEPGFEKTRVNTSTSKIGTIIDITELVDKYKVEKPRQFAQGGVVNDMNRQMKMFAVGGLNDDGVQNDPVSGNEIPPGSLAKEVRDDIPAQLSEGEYVVPADVVRFFGVKHFEDLRNKAKGGLNQMDKDGRIGGEPVAQNKPMELPFGNEELQVRQPAAAPQAKMAGVSMNTVKPRIGMAKGGYVGTSMEAVRMRSGGVVKGYNEGGSVIPSETPRGASTSFANRPNLFQGYGGASGGGALEVRTYVNAAGDTILIPFLNGKIFNGLVIPDGFYLEGSPEATSADGDTQKVTQKVTQDAGGEVDSGDTVSLDTPTVTVKGVTAPEDLDRSDSFFGVNQDFFALSPEGLGTYGEDFGSSGDMLRYAGIASLFAPALGAVGVIAGLGRQVTHANDIANIRAAAQVAIMRGYTDQAIILNARADKMVKGGGLLAKAMDKAGGLSGESIADKVIKSYTTIFDYGSKGDREGLNRDMFNTDDAWNGVLQMNAPRGYTWVSDNTDETGSYQIDPGAETVSIPTSDGKTIEISVGSIPTTDNKNVTGITKINNNDDPFDVFSVSSGSNVVRPRGRNEGTSTTPTTTTGNTTDGKDTNIASSGRNESAVQKDINAALEASNGDWTSELNDLVSERESARAGAGTTSSGGSGVSVTTTSSTGGGWANSSWNPKNW